MNDYFKSMAKTLYMLFSFMLGSYLCMMAGFTLVWGWKWWVGNALAAWLFFTIVYLDTKGILRVVP